MKFKREIYRKGIHLLSSLFIIIYFLFALISYKLALFVLAFLLIIAIEIEYFRVELKANIPILSQLWKLFKRKKEANQLGGEVFFLIGMILSLALFDLKIAIVAILMTVFGDLTAALVGKKFGKTRLPKIKNKALEGVLAEFSIDLIIGLLILNPIIAIVMAVTATFVETVVSKFDDNLLIPLFAGFNGQIVSYLIRIFI